MSKKKGGLMKQKEFKEMCIRIGFVDSNLKIDYARVRTLMALGQIYLIMDTDMEEYPYLYKKLSDDFDIIKEYSRD